MPNVASSQEARTIRLPRPQASLGGDLVQALKSRRSTREFSARPLPEDLLSSLLWCAFGVNRPESGGRTAPSAHGWKEIDVYAALAGGLYRYDAGAHVLTLAVSRDLRGLTGVQDFVAAAPLNLVYVADFARMADASAAEREFFAAVDAGVIAQNVYLCCAAARLATVARGLVDRKRLAPAMGLRQDQRIVLAQTVGFPAT